LVASGLRRTDGHDLQGEADDPHDVVEPSGGGVGGGVGIPRRDRLDDLPELGARRTLEREVDVVEVAGRSDADRLLEAVVQIGQQGVPASSPIRS